MWILDVCALGYKDHRRAKFSLSKSLRKLEALSTGCCEDCPLDSPFAWLLNYITGGIDLLPPPPSSFHICRLFSHKTGEHYPLIPTRSFNIGCFSPACLSFDPPPPSRRGWAVKTGRRSVINMRWVTRVYIRVGGCYMGFAQRVSFWRWYDGKLGLGANIRCFKC